MTEENNKIRLIATGDIMFGGNMHPLLKEKEGDAVFGPLHEAFKGTDIVFGNFEAPVSQSSDAAKDKILLYQDPLVLTGLKRVGYNALSIGNNHIMDYGPEGLTMTMQRLEEQEMQYVGASRKTYPAYQPAVFDVGGQRVVILGYVSPSTELTHGLIYADELTAGLIRFDPKRAVADIKKEKENGADVVIISVHWGVEVCHYPLPEQIAQAHDLIDAGADIILGHHPHIFQGIERYQRGVICYSLGNFIFGEFKLPSGKMEHWADKHRLTAYINFQIEPDHKIDFDIVPMWIGPDMIPKVLTGEQKDKALDKIRQFSQYLGDEHYPKFYNQRVQRQKVLDFVDKLKRRVRHAL